MSKAEIMEELPKLRPDERREILERLCTLEEAGMTPAHQASVDEALANGPAQPASTDKWQETLKRGLARAGKRA